jgi:DNA-binding NarL/FixJ family response regulator
VSALAAATASNQLASRARVTSRPAPGVEQRVRHAEDDRAPSVGSLPAPRIVAIDRRPLLRSGLAGLARRALSCGTQAVGDIDEAAAALRLTGSPPRALLLGLQSGDDPERLVHSARRLGAPVICVLDCDDAVLVRSALRAFADGYIVLGAVGAQTLQQTLVAIESGERVIPDELQRYRAASRGVGTVTARCLEVLRSLAEGLHDDEIAARLGISTSSVRKHIAGAQERLQARTRTQVIAIAARNGLL